MSSIIMNVVASISDNVEEKVVLRLSPTPAPQEDGPAVLAGIYAIGQEGSMTPLFDPQDGERQLAATGTTSKNALDNLEKILLNHFDSRGEPL